MITTSSTYNTIFLDPSHYAETKIVVGDTTYGEDVIMSCERSQTLFGGYFDIGNTVINQIEFTLIGVTADELPRLSRVEVWTRIKNETLTSEWIPMGVYYTTKPDYDTESGLLSVRGYDEMYRTSAIPFSQDSVVTIWNNPSIQRVARHITSGFVTTNIETNFAGIGIEIENYDDIPTNVRMPSIPYNYTVREILTDIAIAVCGNWTMVFSDDGNGGQVGKLRIVRNVNWSGTDIALGRNVTSFAKGDDLEPVTHVYVYYGYDSQGKALYGEAVADTDNGRTYEVEVKTVTTADSVNLIASNILEGMGDSLPYVPFTATGAELDIACELGDTVSVNGITSVLGTITYAFNKGMWADIEAAGLEPVDDFADLSASARTAQRVERSTEVNSAQIAVNADAITAEVTRATGAESDLNTTLSSKITQTASDITISLQTYADNSVSQHAVEQAKYIRYSSDGLELGEEGTMAKALLTNTKLSFQDVNGAEKAYIGQDANDDNIYKFFVINGHIVNQLELGDHWLLVASGSENDYRLTFKWKA